jgi:hypothetical protein
MPPAIFFYDGFAIFGAKGLARIGGPASYGCVRLHSSHAAALFALVERQGRETPDRNFGLAKRAGRILIQAYGWNTKLHHRCLTRPPSFTPR